jgi:DNA repair protein RadC
MQDLDVEEFWVLYLNQQYRLIKKLRIARGGITATTVDIRLIIREAVLCNATQLVACHNHPSGGIMPGDKDDKLTISIIKACQLMDIRFADHVIITDGHYYSYHEEGKC